MTGDRVDGSRIEELRRRLDGPRESERRWAAIGLGRMRATSGTAELVARLPRLRGREHETFTAALEWMADPAAIRGLREWLRRAPDEAVWGVHHTLVSLTGHEPVLEQQPDPDRLRRGDPARVVHLGRYVRAAAGGGR